GISRTPVQNSHRPAPGDVAAMTRFYLTVLPAVCLGSALVLGPRPDAVPSPPADPPPTVEFNRDIRPLLSDNCFQCHGPDKSRRTGALRLDVEKEAVADRGGHRVVVPGNLPKSELWKRITSEDKAEHMPPPSTGKQLTPQQIALVRRWI